VDVREAEDFKKGHVPGALNLPKTEWESMSCLRKDSMNIIYCYTQQCHLAAKAALQFAEAGYQVMEMDGGFEAWKDNDLPIEK
jgi:rhodanese-related sulfurtransferase